MVIHICTPHFCWELLWSGCLGGICYWCWVPWPIQRELHLIWSSLLQTRVWVQGWRTSWHSSNEHIPAGPYSSEEDEIWKILRYCGSQAKMQLLDLINRILKDIYYLTCPQVKLGLASAIHKGKKKPVTRSNSYRRITVSPILGAIIDYYIDPVAEQIFRQVQSPDQLGFTSGISYLLAAVQRGDCQRGQLTTNWHVLEYP